MTIFIVISSIIGLFVLIAIIGGLVSSKVVITTQKVSKPIGEGFLYYYLPESLINIEVKLKIAVTVDKTKKIIESAEVVEQEFVVTEETGSDTSQMYSLDYTSNPFHSDDIEFKTNDNGLLESGSVVTEDKTAAVVTQLIGGVADLSKSAALKSSSVPDVAADEPAIVVIQEYSKSFRERFYSLVTNTVQVKDASAPEGTVGKGTSQKKVNDTPPLSSYTEFEWPLQIEHPDATKPFSKKINFFLEVLDGDTFVHPDGGFTGKLNGVLTRPKKTAKLQFKNDGHQLIGNPAEITVADLSQVYKVPMKRSAFVKREDSITLKDGYLLSHKLVRPSSYAGFASIPVDIAKAIVSIPAQLISIKIDSTKSQTTLNKELANLASAEREKEKQVLTQELAIDKLDLQLKEQEFALEQHLATRDDALQKSIDTAKKVLLDTRKSTLDNEKKIIELQKQIDELKKPKS